MHCEQVRADMDALRTGEVSKNKAAVLQAHLDTCVACQTEYEELIRLAGELRHARSAVRPLQPFDIPDLQQTISLRLPRFAWAAIAVLAAWAVFCTAALMMPSLADKMAFLRIERGSSGISAESTLSLAAAPRAAIDEALRAMSSRNDLVAEAMGGDVGGFLPPGVHSVRVAHLGPLLSSSADEVRLRASVSPAKSQGDGERAEELTLELLLSRGDDGTWSLKRIERIAPE